MVEWILPPEYSQRFSQSTTFLIQMNPTTHKKIVICKFPCQFTPLILCHGRPVQLPHPQNQEKQNSDRSQILSVFSNRLGSVVMSLASEVEGSSCGATSPDLKLAAFFPSGPRWQMWLEHRANYYMPQTTTHMFKCMHVGKYVSYLPKVGGFLPGPPVSSTNKTDVPRYDLRCWKWRQTRINPIQFPKMLKKHDGHTDFQSSVTVAMYYTGITSGK